METEVEVAEPEASSSEILDAAGDAALERLNKEEDPAPAEAEKPAATPTEQGDDDIVAWVKGLDKQTLADLKEAKLIPKHRFDEVNQGYERYKSFGTPEELAAKLAEIQKKPGEPEKSTTEASATELTAEEKEAHALLLKLFPHLKDLPDTTKQMRDFMQQNETRVKEEKERQDREQTAYVGKAVETIKALAKEAGLNVENKKSLDLICNGVTTLLHQNEELSRQFYRDRNPEVLKEVFKDYHNLQFSGYQRKLDAASLKDKNNQRKLPKAPAPGGAPETEQPDDVGSLDWNKIGDRAISRLD